MCSGPQVSVLIAQLHAQASSCSSGGGGSSSSSTERVFAHEDENLSIEPVLLAQCVAHCVSIERIKDAGSLAKHVDVNALQAAEGLKQLLGEASVLPVASVLHCGGAMRQPARCVRP
jgi:hypothetical protein